MRYALSIVCLCVGLSTQVMAQPQVGITTPQTNTTFAEGVDIPVSLTATTSVGSLSAVDLLLNGQKLTTFLAATATQPYSYTLKDLLPASYTLTARATGNAGAVGTSTPVAMLVTFADGTVGPYAHWNFDKGLDYWKLVSDWRNEGTFGWHGTPSLWGFNIQEANMAASPGISLKAGETYTVEFVDACKSNLVPIRVLYAPAQSLQDTTFIFGYKSASTSNFLVRRAGTFVAPRDGIYHIIIRNDWRTGAYQKMYFDNLRVRGNGLNNAPLSKITFPAAASLTVPIGSTLSLQSTATDPDGSVIRVDYYANSQKIGSSTSANYALDWSGYGVGTYDVTSRAVDNQGASVGYVPLRLVVVANNFTSASYLGGTSDAEDVRGSVIQQNGAIVLAANLGAVSFPGVVPKLLNGATATSPGCLLKLTADGKTVLALTRLAARVTDLARDSTDNLYLAAGADGMLKLNVAADTILWKKTMPTGRYVWRVDAGPGGTNMYLSSTSTDPDGQLSGTEIKVQNREGVELGNFGAVSQYSGDVVVDEATGTAIGVGFRNFNAQTNAGRLPVYVPVIRGMSFNCATTKYVAYNWEADSLLADGSRNPRWLNASNNNMADVRAFRASLGLDGKLYVAYEVAGGNHALRYSPFDIMQKVTVVGGDNFADFNNSNTEIKLFVGRYEPATGQYALGQQFTARLPSTKANTVFSKYGAIAADEDGRAYVTGASAYGIPITVDHQPGDYLGGAYLLILSPDMATREAVVRLTTDGRGHTLAIKNRDYFVWGGMTKTVLFRVDPLQPNAGSLQDGWFATLSRTALARCTTARLRTSLRTGAWQSPNTWSCGLLPTLSDKALVSPGHVVKLTGQAAANQLIEQGKLLIGSGAKVRIGE
ncbi:Ig-like domain-containing protein [Fibrella aquatilis]|uniref:Uncharacterized protein n=1 Tax=Fibrella aquatilis TaxID=2817059 RepID=A0A939G7F3_9BACT|nr:Ig-like domain-containing protein [Fibrella aquatilis]MBO0931416.1 hypothetical protein [Fibrella aquatilis]